jgi:hypothetical protein
MASVVPAVWSMVVVDGPDLGRKIDLNEAIVCIGRGKNDDLVLLDTGVTRRQFVVEWDSQMDCHVLWQTGDSYTAINNISVTRNAGVRHELAEGDQIQFGQTVLRYLKQSCRRMSNEV